MTHPIVTQIPLAQLPGYRAAMEEMAEQRRLDAPALRAFAADRASIAAGLIARETNFLAESSAFSDEDFAKMAAPAPPPDDQPEAEAEGLEEAATPPAAPGESPAPETLPKPSIAGTDDRHTPMRSLRDLSTDEAAELRAAWEGGASRADLSRRFRLPATSIDSRAALKGWKRHGSALPAGVTDEDMGEARQMISQGQGARALAEYFGWTLADAQRIAAQIRAEQEKAA